MPQQHKNKLHFIYSNNQSLPIYVSNHLDILLTIFHVNFSKEESTFQKRQKLYSVLLSLGRVDISPWHFMEFIYSDDGYKDILKNKNTIITTTVQLNKKLCKNSIKYSKPVINQDDDNTITLVGKEGERIVYDYLKSNKTKLDIIGNIEKVCEKKISYDHCDFKYKKVDGTTVYIEVKATRLDDPKNYHFIMSRYEYEFMNNHANEYYLYYVNDVFGKHNITVLRPSEFKHLLEPESYYLDATV